MGKDIWPTREEWPWAEPISHEDFSKAYGVPLDEVTTDMIIIHEEIISLQNANRNLKEEFDYDWLRHAIARAANIFMAFPKPEGGHNYMAFTPATSAYLFGEDDYYDPEVKI